MCKNCKFSTIDCGKARREKRITRHQAVYCRLGDRYTTCFLSSQITSRLVRLRVLLQPQPTGQLASLRLCRRQVLRVEITSNAGCLHGKTKRAVVFRKLFFLDSKLDSISAVIWLYSANARVQRDTVYKLQIDVVRQAL